MCRVRTIGPPHNPKLFDFKSCLMRRTDHKNGTLSLARRPWLVIYMHQSDSSSCSDCASVTLQKGAGLCRYAAFNTQHNALCDRIQLWYDCFYLHFYPKEASSCYGQSPHQTTEGVYLLSM